MFTGDAPSREADFVVETFQTVIGELQHKGKELELRSQRDRERADRSERFAERVIAQMPTGFNLSSALIERIAGEDFLFISASNGRVYCINMAGRGDMNLTTHKPGTTTRSGPPCRAGSMGLPINWSAKGMTTCTPSSVWTPSSPRKRA